jgi:hypothetical protein
VLSHEEASGENYEASHSKRGVDADQYPHGPPIEEMCGKKPGADQCRQRNQRSGNYVEGGGALVKPRGGPRKARMSQPRPPMATSPCSAVSGQGAL